MSRLTPIKQMIRGNTNHGTGKFCAHTTGQTDLIPRSLSKRIAALCPAQPITEPAGCVPALAEYNSLHRSSIWQAVRKTKGIVNMMDMPKRYTKMTFNFLWMKRKCVSNKITCAGRKTIANGKKLFYITVLLLPPRLYPLVRMEPIEQTKLNYDVLLHPLVMDQPLYVCTILLLGKDIIYLLLTALNPSLRLCITSCSSGKRWMVVPYCPRSSGRQVNFGSPFNARLTLNVEPGRL